MHFSFCIIVSFSFRVCSCQTLWENFVCICQEHYYILMETDFLYNVFTTIYMKVNIYIIWEQV